jgi:hypothetical protein
VGLGDGVPRRSSGCGESVIAEDENAFRGGDTLLKAALEVCKGAEYKKEDNLDMEHQA